MKIYENSIGWETKDGMQVAYKPEFAFINCCIHPNYVRPIWEKSEDDASWRGQE